MTSTSDELTETETTILGFEKLTWQYSGTKEQRIREELDMNLTRYHQILNAMLDDPRVEAADPVTVRRLQRVRDSRLRAGVAQRLGLT